MTLEELGLVLRAEREKKGQSIEEIADHLKIGVRLLRALEEGDTASLPHISYAKGFIKSYCHYLGLADGELQEAISSLKNNAIADTIENFANVKTAKPASISRLLPILILLFIASGCFLAYQYDLPALLNKYTHMITQKMEPKPLSSPSETPQSRQQPVQPKPEPPLVERAHAIQPESPQPLASAPLPTVAEKEEPQEADRKEEQNIQAAQADNIPSNEQKTLPEVAPPSQHKVIISAIEECWIHSNADNSDTRQFSLRKGDTFALTFKTSLVLKLGNAGGVRIRFDGQDLAAPGQLGQVRTISFPMSN